MSKFHFSFMFNFHLNQKWNIQNEKLKVNGKKKQLHKSNRRKNLIEMNLHRVSWWDDISEILYLNNKLKKVYLNILYVPVESRARKLLNYTTFSKNWIQYNVECLNTDMMSKWKELSPFLLLVILTDLKHPLQTDWWTLKAK